MPFNIPVIKQLIIEILLSLYQLKYFFVSNDNLNDKKIITKNLKYLFASIILFDTFVITTAILDKLHYGVYLSHSIVWLRDNTPFGLSLYVIIAIAFISIHLSKILLDRAVPDKILQKTFTDYAKTIKSRKDKSKTKYLLSGLLFILFPIILLIVIFIKK